MTDRNRIDPGAQDGGDPGDGESAAQPNPEARFFSQVRHQVRQPLHALALYLAAIKRRSGDQQTAGMITRAEQAAAELLQMIEAILALAILMTGGAKPNVQIFRVESVLAELPGATPQDDERKALDIRIVSSGAQVRADSAIVKEILLQLLAFCALAGAGGRCVIGCRRRAKDVFIEVHFPGALPEDAAALAAADLSRADQLSPGAYDGPGLALLLAARLARTLDTSIGMVSRPPLAAFRIRLPAE